MSPEQPRRPGPRSVDGFRRGGVQPSVPQPSLPATPQAESTPPADSHLPAIDMTTPDDAVKPPRAGRKKLLWTIIGAVLGLILVCIAALYLWYRHELSPVNSHDTTKQTFVVKAGATPHQIADGLETEHLIRSAPVFYVYLVLSHQRDTLQAGSYQLSPSLSSQEVVQKMTHGAVSNFSVTFYPGGTLSGSLRLEPKYSVTTQLKNAGFSAAEIRTALAGVYDQPGLFLGKPAKSSLEGYIYGDTYTFAAGASAQSVITRSLKEFAQVVAQNDLVDLYKKQHLTLYQGVTLASIVQREIDEGDAGKGPTEDQKQVAQVFLLRLQKHMTLGSDVTYYYGAEQLGVTPSPDVDSPYNTRKYPGLPPGPIATPGLNALLAVAHPATTDYLYFVSGDDGKTYFSKTDAGHQENVKNHCQKKCQY